MQLWRIFIAALGVLTASSLPARSDRLGSSPIQNASLASDRLLFAQNEARMLAGRQAMTWDPTLASAAADYASELAATNKWEHSSPDRRRGQGENLWMGTHSAFTPEQMIGGWVAEQRLFRAGTFPDVSTSGSWHEVGHYTQIIWPETSRVGCAIRSNASYDYLVCRYASPGNVMGERIGPALLAAR